MKRLMLAAVFPALWAAPAAAQMDPNMPGMSMPGMAMPGMAPSQTAKSKPAGKSKPPHPAKHAKRSQTGKHLAAHARAGAPAGATPGMPIAAPESSAMSGMPMPAQNGSAMSGMAMPGQNGGGMNGMDMSGQGAGGMPKMDMSGQGAGAMPKMDMSGQGAGGMPKMDMSGQGAGAMPGMAMPAATAAEPPIPDTPPPPAARDHPADQFYDPAAMAAARSDMRVEMGGMPFSMVMVNLAEYQVGRHGDGYRWEGQAWYGGDINRLVLSSEGSGSVRNGLDSGEVQALYSRAISPYVDVQTGVRQDFAPLGRTYLALGTQALFPYWFNVQEEIFLSTQGELLARVEGTYDLRLTQRWVLQPRVELNLAAQDTPQTRTGSGLSDAELGLRLRYEVRREFAPYIGVSYERQVGKTAEYVRAAGEDPESATFVVGVASWF